MIQSTYRIALLSLFLFTAIDCANVNKANRKLATLDPIALEKKIVELIRTSLAHGERNPGRYTIRELPLGDYFENITNGEELYSVMNEAAKLIDPIYSQKTTEFLAKFFRRNFSKSERMQLLNSCHQADLRQGGELFAVLGYMPSCFEEGNFLLELSDLDEALRNFPRNPSSVKYNGETARMVYSDSKLKTYVNIISHFLITDKISFRELFFNLPREIQSKFTKNSYTTSEESKIEPFDLVLQNVTEGIYSELGGYYFSDAKPINFIELSKTVKIALAQALLVTNERDAFAWQSPTLSIKKDLNDFVALCANGVYKMSPSILGSGKNPASIYFRNQLPQGSIVEAWELDHKVIDLINDDEVVVDFRCAPNRYQIKLREIKATRIPIPKPLIFPKTIQALMTIALSEEIKEHERQLIKIYLAQMEGWSIHKDYSEVETKDAFEKLFGAIDIYLPVSHSMDVNHFLVGTGHSQYLILKKNFIESGKSREVFLHILLPQKKKERLPTVTYGVKALANLYSARRAQGKPSLFLMNISCGSEGTLGTWTHVYRESVKNEISDRKNKSIEDFKDLPYIIGSKRYFDTESIADLAVHINYPLEAIRILAEGGTPKTVAEFLNEPDQSKFIDKISSLVGVPKEKLRSTGFEPVFNLDIPKIMTFGGFEIELKNLETGQSQIY